ncbi:MAG TPA: CHAT domain-containing protein, partial [Mycobacteriales bacterium]|nr:CHAT domain-containing protein [Mycobacteriales bacterium]
MTHRLVFELSDSIAPDGSPLVEIALKEPKVWASPRQPFPFRGTEPVFLGLTSVPLADAALRTVGRTLYDAVAGRPPLADTFAEALRTQLPERYPLFVEIDSASQVESLPWEALCGADGTFLGLDDRWAIGRIIDAPRPPASPRDLVLPLKVAAVLSALHVPAGQEWQALWDSIGAVPGLPVELLVLASEDELAGTIDTAVAPAGVSVTVEQVPDSTEALQQRIRTFNPHVLHFFCHGSAGRRQPYLEVAVRSDWVTTTKQSLFLEAGQFRDLTERTSDRPWLLVLNCCESAAAGPRDNLQSLALMLVRDAALPAVVGMREPVSSTDASTFTRAFYTALLSEVDGRRTGAVAADEPLNWARYAVRARTTLLDRLGLPRTEAAESTREWTLPVVYLRPEPFVVTVPAVAAVPAPAEAAPPEAAPPGPAPAGAAPPGAAPAEAGPPEVGPGEPGPAEALPPVFVPLDPVPLDAVPPELVPPVPVPVPAAAAPPSIAPPPPPPDGGDAARSARLEADLLHGLLTRLPPGTPADLIA